MSEETSEKDLEERVSKLESLVEDQQETIEEQEEYITELEQQATVLDSRADHILEAIESNESRLDSLEEFRRELIESQLAQQDVAMESQLTVAERILCFGWDGVEIDKDEHKNKRRAIILLKNWDSYSTGTSNGSRITYTEIQKILTNETGKNTQWITADRVANEIETLTEGKIEVQNSNTKCVYKPNSVTLTDDVSEVMDETED